MRPVVILGRGGGGTRLLSEAVRGLGVFMGNHLNESNDSVEWVDTIYDLSIRRWQNPEPEAGLETAIGPEQLRKQAALILHAKGIAPAHPWGWKLPETTLIAPMVKQAFPRARLIHLVRHPVTACCRRSHMTSRSGTPLGRAALDAAYRFVGRSRALIDADPEHIRNAVSWAFQTEIMLCLFTGDEIDDTILTVKFEDICNRTESVSETLGKHLGLSVPQGPLFSVDAKRAANEAPDIAARKEVWDICEPQAIRFGYSPALEQQ